MANFELKSLQFRKERESGWRELERLVTQAESGGLGDLEPQDLARLPVLYRAALSSLSVARSISLDRAGQYYLEALCGRAYLIMYRPRRNFLKATAAFFRSGFPRAVRECRRAMLLASCVLVLGFAVGYFETRRDPERFYLFIDQGLAGGRSPEASSEDLAEVIYSKGEEADVELTQFSAMLFTNNSRVALLSFALGGLAGVPTTILVFKNGTPLGALAAVYAEKDMSLGFWGWILPHGVTELLALILSAAAGLHIGYSLVFPGRRLRRDALREAGRRAGTIAMGVVLMLFIAGLIEGIFRQRVQSDLIRYLLACSSAIFWVFYLGFAGKLKS